jgi:hypothetical protein
MERDKANRNLILKGTARMAKRKIFYWDGKPGTAPGTAPDEYLVWDCDANAPMPGWYWGGPVDPHGPFATKQAAQANKGD